MTYTLSVVQALLALLFLFTGGIDVLQSLLALKAGSGWFRLFIGVAKVLGALGLVLPGLLRVRPGLTPLAAVGLTLIMIRATVVTLIRGGDMPEEYLMSAIMTRATVKLIGGDVAPQIMWAASTAFVGLLAAFVAYGRWRPAPYRSDIPPAHAPAPPGRSRSSQVGATLIFLGTVAWTLLAFTAFLNWPLRQEGAWAFGMMAIVAVPIALVLNLAGTVVLSRALATGPTKEDIAIIALGILGVVAPIAIVLLV